ncbi:efflux transporter outer membrane subunit [Desulfosarcina ovata]|uniref:Membrane protein n=1 Tax=Desulfosarcina ovata subsp. ovata TaxID=2752305 RepID=A0A5K8AFM9_9BACT|nr:efflux transporter outer membrane subunit [Desulfosarcina ovata]BBO90700.1 membrane protein [Desulfosarcina ovata subsp. ovata]
MMKWICITLSALTVTACAMFAPQDRPNTPISLPSAYSLYTDSDPVPDRWWEAFGSDELNQLVGTALAGNFDVRTAWARLKQADAVARQAGADRMPTLDANAGAEKSWQQTKTDAAGTSHSNSRSFSAGLTAAYELDLWGRLAALHRSERLELKASAEDLAAAAVTVSAEVTTAWIEILSLHRQIAILKDQIDINQRMLKLQELRFINGQADALDVAQQREALADAKANLPPLQLTEQQQQNALAVLLGQAGIGEFALTQETLPSLIPLPATGLPADLLAARPDVRAAGLRLKEADWQVSAARADRLPSITLSADAAFSSDALDLLLSNWVSTLAASLTGPVFDAGYRSAEVDRTRAVADEYLTAYAQTVAEAIQEVEDSLATETRQGEYITLLEEQLKASRLTLKDAHLQYMNGQDNYLDYLTAWTSVQTLERQLVDEQATLIKNRVTLYRALGGDWTGALIGGRFLEKNTGATKPAARTGGTTVSELG